MFAGTQHTKEQNELNTREREGQDATNITSVFADSCIQFLWSVMPILMTTLTWTVRIIPNRNTIEEFAEEIDEPGFVGQKIFFYLPIRMLCALFFQLCDHDNTNTTLCREVGQMVFGR